jgi:hypothetical protein
MLGVEGVVVVFLIAFGSSRTGKKEKGRVVSEPKKAADKHLVRTATQSFARCPRQSEPLTTKSNK